MKRPSPLGKMPSAAAIALAAALLAGPASACRPGDVLPCRGLPSPADRDVTAPLTREDIIARTGRPGPAVTREVAQDTDRAWQAVRRQRPLPDVAFREFLPQKDVKGGSP